MKNDSLRKSINIDKPNHSPIWSFKQEDDGILKLALFKGSTAFDITGQTVKLGAKRPNNSIVELTTGFTINTNELDITLMNNILAVPGIVECDLELTDAEGKMTTASFYLAVNKKMTGETTIDASNDIAAINKIVAEVLAKGEKLEVEINAVIAEANKKITAIDVALNNKLTEMQTDYDSLKKIIIDENQAANLQVQINQTNSQLETNTTQLEEHLTNHPSGGGVDIDDVKEVVKNATKEQIDKYVADGTIANMTIADGSITVDKVDFAKEVLTSLSYANKINNRAIVVENGVAKIKIIVGSIYVYKIESNTKYKITVLNNTRFRVCELNTEYESVDFSKEVVADELIVNDDTVNCFSFTTSINAKTLVVYLRNDNLEAQQECFKVEYIDTFKQKEVTNEYIKDKAITINKCDFINTEYNDFVENVFDGVYLEGVLVGDARNVNDKQMYISTSTDKKMITAKINVEKNTRYSIKLNGEFNRYRIAGLFADKELSSTKTISDLDFTEFGDKYREMIINTNNCTVIFIYVSNQGIKPMLTVSKGYKEGISFNDVLFADGLKRKITEYDIADSSITKEHLKFSIFENLGYAKTSLPSSEWITNSKSTEIYAKFDELLNKYPDYISKELIGNEPSSHSLPIYQYSFKQKPINGLVLNTPKILIDACMHGNEKMGVWELYNFMVDVCDNWKTNQDLENLRWNYDIITIPILNPYGFDFNKRETSSGLDPNREFNKNVSEMLYESKLLKEFLDNNKDSLFHFNLHTQWSASGNGVFHWLSDNMKFNLIGAKTLKKVSRLLQTQYEFVEQNEGFIFGKMGEFDYITEETHDSQVHAYAEKIGLKSCTLEIAQSVNYQNETVNGKLTTNIATQWLGNSILVAINDLMYV